MIPLDTKLNTIKKGLNNKYRMCRVCALPDCTVSCHIAGFINVQFLTGY